MLSLKPMNQGSVFQLLYVSKSNHPVTLEFMNQILEVSQRRNPQDNLTGFLTARDGFFLQLLEGPEANVRACYERIEKDPRHTDLKILGEITSSARLFPNWSMGHVPTEKVTTSSKDLLYILEMARQGGSYNTAENLQTILRIFAKNVQSL